MDVLVLIDKLDDLVHNAKAVPLTDQVRIDREEIARDRHSGELRLHVVADAVEESPGKAFVGGQRATGEQ